MTRPVVAWAAALAVLASPAAAQDHGAPAKAAAPKAAHAPAPAAAPVAAKPTVPAPSAPPAAPKPAAPASASHGPVIAPGKPVIAPRINGMGDAAIPKTPSRGPKTTQVSVSARQAAEKTIAALVEAMKSLPKRPPAPPEARTAAARRSAAAARVAAAEGPVPITYHVTWPSAPEEPGVTTRVELAWPDAQSGGPVSLRWNPPAPE